MSKVDPVSLLANVATGGLYGIGKAALNAATGKEDLVSAGKDALAVTGPAGSAMQPTIGTNKTLAAEGAVAGAAGGAAGLSAMSADSSALAPVATDAVEQTGSTMSAAQGAAATEAPAATGSSTMAKLAVAAPVAGAAMQGASMLTKPKMPDMPAAPDVPTQQNTEPAQAAAEAKVMDDQQKKTRTLLTGGQGATDYGKNSFAPSLIGNNTYLKSVIG